jgi:two-component system, response regulator / RNA-binding antiterminator
MDGSSPLRVLLANEKPARLDLLAGVLAELGHTVVAQEVRVSDVGAVTARSHPDVALVGLGDDAEHALGLITEIVSEASCPVIALLGTYDGGWVARAASVGVFAYIVDTGPDELQSAIEITLRRYAEYQRLQGAFERRQQEYEREEERRAVQQRQALALHDSVVQSLTAAQLALDLELIPESRGAIVDALDTTRSFITTALGELRLQGSSLEELIRDSTDAGGE